MGLAEDILEITHSSDGMKNMVRNETGPETPL
jgi:hypothetical protein